MKFAALISGGKDSILSIAIAISNGHQLEALVHLKPISGLEQDSYMYQSVGSEVVSLIAQCIDAPLYTLPIKPNSINTNLEYVPTQNDEVESMAELLQIVISKHPSITALTSGAILSQYQKNRVENVCKRLGLVSLAYLWGKPQKQILECGINWGMDARLIKVCSLGLNKSHLGKSLKEMQEHLYNLSNKYGVSICGEGGEYESLVVDCPLYKSRIHIVESEIVCHDAKSDVYYLKLKACLEAKGSISNEEVVSKCKEVNL